MNFGPETDEPTSFAIMDSALDAGINFFDSANVYGRSKGRGATEEIVGRWFAQGGGRREKVVLATKLYGDMGEWPNEGRLSALNIRRACDASLQRLQTDYIDLYQMHHIDRRTGWDEIWEAMEVLRTQGKILYVGLLQLRRLAHRPGPGGGRSPQLHGPGQRAVDLQPHRAQRRGRGAAGRRGLRARGDSLVAAPGRAARRCRAQGARREPPLRGPGRRDHRGAAAPARGLRGPVCRGRRGARDGRPGLAPDPAGRDRADRRAALPDHLDSAMRAVDVTLDDKVLTRLDEIFPGHKTAPEDYAW